MGVGQCPCEDLQRRLPVVRDPGPRIEAVGDGVQVRLRRHRQVGALGQVLADQPVGVLAGAALSRAVRVAEVDLTPVWAVRSAWRVISALVVGQAVAHRFGDRVELGREAGQRRGGAGVVHPGQQHQTAGALDQHADRGGVARSLDKVAVQWPGITRSSTSGGRTWMLSMVGVRCAEQRPACVVGVC